MRYCSPPAVRSRVSPGLFKMQNQVIGRAPNSLPRPWICVSLPVVKSLPSPRLGAHAVVQWLAALLLLLAAGCASAGFGGSTLRGIQTNMDWNMSGYEQANIHGMMTENQRQQVRAANQAYQAAFRAAVAKAGGNLEAPAPPEVIARANQLLAVLDSL